MRVGINIDPAVVIEDGAFHNRQAQTHAARFGRAERGENLSFRSAEIPLPLSCTVTTTPLVCLPSRIGFAASVIRGFGPARESASAALATRCAKASASAVSSPSTCGRSFGRVVSIGTPLLLNRARASSIAFLTDARTIDRFHHQLRRVGEVVDLGNDLVEPVDFLDDDFVKIVPEIRHRRNARAGAAQKS